MSPSLYLFFTSDLTNRIRIRYKTRQAGLSIAPTPCFQTQKNHQSWPLVFVAVLSDQFILSQERAGNFSMGTFYQYRFCYGLKGAVLDCGPNFIHQMKSLKTDHCLKQEVRRDKSILKRGIVETGSSVGEPVFKGQR